ncbi:MAG: DUF4340 domain-containing protein [Phycisphaerae bacterium]
MNNKKLTILGLIAAFMLVWAVMQAKIAGRPASPRISSASLIQGLNPDKVRQIEIKAADLSLELRRAGNIFVVPDKDNFPARSDRINELFTQLLDIRMTELITNNPANHKELQVTEENASHVIKFLDEKNELITGIILGNRTEQGGQYARLAGANEVYLVLDVPWIRTSPLDYIEQNLLQLNTENIASVTVTDSGGFSYTLKSDPNSGEVSLSVPIPAGKQLSPEHKNVFSALRSFRLEDVMRDSSVPEELVFDKTYICNLKDSSIYIIKLAESQNGDTFVQCSAVFSDKQDVVIDITRQESDEELRKKEAKLLALEAVERFNRRCKGWTFKIPSWIANNLTKPLDELLEDIKEPDNAEEIED